MEKNNNINSSNSLVFGRWPQTKALAWYTDIVTHKSTKFHTELEGFLRIKKQINK